MQITVAQILEEENLKKAKVVAGKKGLSSIVTSVTVGEVPDIADWLKGGEIVLSTLYAVGEKPEEQFIFIEKLIQAKASALFVKPKRFIGKLDSRIIDLAEKKKFPVIEVPPEIRWTEIVGKIYHKIIGEHLAFQERSFEIHSKLLGEVIKGGGYDSITDTLASLINRPVLLEDADGKIIASAKLTKEHTNMLEKIGESDKAEPLEHGTRIRLKKDQKYPAKVSIPIVVEQNTLGFVSALEIKRALNKLDKIALEHTATVAAVEMGKERIKFETEMRLKGDFIDDLMGNHFQSSVTLLKRAKMLGCNLDKGSLVLIIDIDNFDRYAEQNSEEKIQRLRREFFNTCNWIIDLEYQKSFSSLKSDSVIVFLTPKDENKTIVGDCERIASALQKGLSQRFKNFTFSIAYSNYYKTPEKINKAFTEARTALDISKRLGGTEKTTSFKEIGTYRLLVNMLDNNPEELEDFLSESIGPLVEYDKKHDSELTKTLEAYFNHDENINETAKALFAHRHTIRYRLERIKELTGLDIYKSDDKESLALGLKLSHLIK